MSLAPALLTKSEVIQRLGVCERTLEKLVRARQFPQGLKLGKHVVWADVAVENWLSLALPGSRTPAQLDAATEGA